VENEMQNLEPKQHVLSHISVVAKFHISIVAIRLPRLTSLDEKPGGADPTEGTTTTTQSGKGVLPFVK
jgi:hypothetical protein